MRLPDPELLADGMAAYSAGSRLAEERFDRMTRKPFAMRFQERAEPFRDAAGNIDWHNYRLAMGVNSFMHPNELLLLSQLADGKDYMEVGGYKGGSAWCVAHTAASVTTIDTFRAADNGQTQQDNYTTLAEYDRVTAEFTDVVTRIPFSSERAYELLPETATWDVIFIDGDHTCEGCLADLKRWWPRVRPGGVMAIHDVGHDHWPGATQAADEMFGPETEPRVVTLRVVRKPSLPDGRPGMSAEGLKRLDDLQDSVDRFARAVFAGEATPPV